MKYKLKGKPFFYSGTLFLIYSVLLLSSCRERGKAKYSNNNKESGITNFTDTSISTVKVFTSNGKVCIQKSNTYYELTDVYDGATKIPLLLKIKKTELCVADSTNKEKVYQIETHNVLDSKSIQWSNQFVATNISFQDNTILAVHEGTDTNEDFLMRYSLLDGKQVFSCSYGELKVAIPNVKDKRFIGYTSKKAASNPIQNKNEENLLGIVRYSNSIKEINACKVILKRSVIANRIPSTTPDMLLVPASENVSTIEDGKTVIMMKADEHYTSKDVGGFSVQMTFYYGDDNESAVISIPVTDDKLDFTHAKYDKDIFQITSN